ncbi:hypothetical protein EDB92DRAFT_1273072 [Lactarius akahatsu]|uniref:Uncharacterized protein n=1 Tax=Lactarius akahatsu TaxID=416441 RepID=A0AAD4Q5P1_9AGAM|nr:hypothetical protein EDB92DRAFT_1273072 [Lactarius akahatsu]
MRPEPNSVLQCLSLNGYSVFSLIDDILAHGCNQEDPGIKLLREGVLVERNAASICSHLLNHNPTSSSVSSWALGFSQATLRTFSLWNNNVVSPNFPSGIAWTSTGGPGKFLNMGRVLFNNHRYGATIDMRPDNVLLEIFDFCLVRDSTEIMFKFEVILYTRQWQILVHVCQRWRRIGFESHAVLKSTFAAHTEYLSGGISVSGRSPCLSPLTTPAFPPALLLRMKIVSLLHLAPPAVYTVSIFLHGPTDKKSDRYDADVICCADTSGPCMCS